MHAERAAILWVVREHCTYCALVAVAGGGRELADAIGTVGGISNQSASLFAAGSPTMAMERCASSTLLFSAGGH